MRYSSPSSRSPATNWASSAARFTSLTRRTGRYGPRSPEALPGGRSVCRDRSGNPLPHRQTDLPPGKASGDLGPYLLVRLVNEVKCAALDAQFVAGDREDGLE